jgi:hypothetical protein
MSDQKPSRLEIERGICLPFEPGGVVEVRSAKTRPGVVAEYLDTAWTAVQWLNSAMGNSSV